MNKYEKEAVFMFFIVVIASIAIAVLALQLERAEEQLSSSCLNGDHYEATKK
jgi:hypothetical protein